MEIIKIDQNAIDPSALKKAVAALKGGEVVMHPTETCYGLAVDIFRETALRKLYQLKQMELSKPVTVMVTGLEEAQNYAEFNELAIRLAGKFWPGPLTLVLPRKSFLPDYLNRGNDTVGVRCPDSEISLQLVRGVGRPLSTTSANISGKPEAYKVEDYLAQIKDLGGLGPAVVLDVGELSQNPPSTVVAFDVNGPFLLREGALAEEVKGFFKL